ncbi:hypothetical protein C0033_11140 [Clostridium sp. chh4-2]|uniref:hypothetical protein n=1 Tax=Clostridium sp. chh4-2 TaxID=2067550 RepID=UPI000CCDB076|nr:hypothetical protein [Clostridium sp. chh4-2]PNV61797.1 hypothetical protein C0033_11140 [Clostridium sp. chh4-2]
MKRYCKTAIITVTLVSFLLTGCAKTARIGQSPETQTEETSIEETTGPKAMAVETNESIEQESVAKTYYMKTDKASYLVPSLTLFEDGHFGLSYDALSSYYNYGTYERKDGKLIAETEDGLKHYVFKEDNEQFIFIQDESSEITLTDPRIGMGVTDGSVFTLQEPERMERMSITAAVKEIEENYLLISSKADIMPGVYCVYYGDLDISGIEGGDEIWIEWDGEVVEDNKIYADRLEKR